MVISPASEEARRLLEACDVVAAAPCYFYWSLPLGELRGALVVVQPVPIRVVMGVRETDSQTVTYAGSNRVYHYKAVREPNGGQPTRTLEVAENVGPIVRRVAPRIADAIRDTFPSFRGVDVVQISETGTGDSVPTAVMAMDARWLALAAALFVLHKRVTAEEIMDWARHDDWSAVGLSKLPHDVINLFSLGRAFCEANVRQEIRGVGWPGAGLLCGFRATSSPILFAPCEPEGSSTGIGFQALGSEMPSGGVFDLALVASGEEPRNFEDVQETVSRYESERAGGKVMGEDVASALCAQLGNRFSGLARLPMSVSVESGRSITLFEMLERFADRSKDRDLRRELYQFIEGEYGFDPQASHPLRVPERVRNLVLGLKSNGGVRAAKAGAGLRGSGLLCLGETRDLLKALPDQIVTENQRLPATGLGPKVIMTEYLTRYCDEQWYPGYPVPFPWSSAFQPGMWVGPPGEFLSMIGSTGSQSTTTQPAIVAKETITSLGRHVEMVEAVEDGRRCQVSEGDCVPKRFQFFVDLPGKSAHFFEKPYELANRPTQLEFLEILARHGHDHASFASLQDELDKKPSNKRNSSGKRPVRKVIDDINKGTGNALKRLFDDIGGLRLKQEFGVCLLVRRI